MLQLWPPASGLPAIVEADFCLALARLNESAGREEHWQAACRAETLYRQLGNADRLGDALLLIGTIGLNRNHVSEAQRALREAEELVTDDTALRKQAALAATQGECYGYLDENERSIAAFRRQCEFYHRADAPLGEYLALGNVGSAQLQANELDAAIDSLSTAVDGLRRLNAPYGLDFRVSMLSIALALRGDTSDVLALAREAFEQLRALGATSGPLLAAALHHARHGDLQRAVMLAGYALGAPKRNPAPTCLQLLLRVQQRVRDRALTEHSGAVVKQWSWDGSTNLQWQLVDVGGGYYRIVNRTNGMVIDSWGSATNGANARQAPWNGGNNQQWRLNDVGNGRVQIINRGTNTALDGMGNATVGSTVGMWAPNNNTNNQWTITAV